MTETRAEKAQRLVDEGHVNITFHHARLTNAWVQGDHGRYRVVLYPNGHYLCFCKWGDIHSHTDDLCAHALAVKLAMERKDKPC